MPMTTGRALLRRTLAAAALAAPLALALAPSGAWSENVLRVIPKGANVTGLDGVRNNFRKVTYKGTTGWAYRDYLA